MMIGKILLIIFRNFLVKGLTTDSLYDIFIM